MVLDMVLKINDSQLFGQKDVRETTPGLTNLQAALDYATFRGINCGEPTAAQDVATKNYVDTTVAFNTTSTYYASIAGAAFLPENLSNDVVGYGEDTGDCENSTEVNEEFIASIQLPHGAVVTGAKLYGDLSGGTPLWTLRRRALTAGVSDVMAAAAMNVESTTISNATVNNETYLYFMACLDLPDGGFIYGARVTYTF